MSICRFFPFFFLFFFLFPSRRESDCVSRNRVSLFVGQLFFALVFRSPFSGVSASRTWFSSRAPSFRCFRRASELQRRSRFRRCQFQERAERRGFNGTPRAGCVSISSRGPSIFLLSTFPSRANFDHCCARLLKCGSYSFYSASGGVARLVIDLILLFQRYRSGVHFIFRAFTPGLFSKYFLQWNWVKNWQ